MASPSSPLPASSSLQPAANNPASADQQADDSNANESSFSAGYVKRRTTLPRSTRALGRGIVWSLIGLTVFAIFYGSLNKIDSSIDVRGTLEPVTGKRDISPPINGLVKNVFVKNGAIVGVGSPLFTLLDDSTAAILRNLKLIRQFWLAELVTSSQLLGITSNSEQSTSTLARLNLSISQEESKIKKLSSLEELKRSINEIRQAESDLTGTETQLSSNRDILSRYRLLYSQGAVSELDALKQSDIVSRLEATQRRQELEVFNAQRKFNQSKLQSNFVAASERKQLYNRYQTSAQELYQIDNRIADQTQRLSLQTVKAPIAGSVHNLSVNPGELATPNRPSMTIISVDRLQVKINIKDSDIGFVRLGMPVEIRIDSYPFTEYGALKGRLTSIASYSLPPDQAFPFTRFTATVALMENSLKTKKGLTHPLRAGMSISGLIIVAKRPLISIITDKLNVFFDSPRRIR